MLRHLPKLTRTIPLQPARSLATQPPRLKDFRRAAPPPLPAEDQAEFERLQREAAVAPRMPEAQELEERLEELEHPDMRKGAKPEFEGEVNPKTGEVGGPKRDPFGAGNSDWQFGGRDF